MKLGLMSAALPSLSLAELAAWASYNGFEMLELACWPVSKAERRYAGVTHIDVTDLTPTKAKDILGLMDRHTLQISESVLKAHFAVILRRQAPKNLCVCAENEILRPLRSLRMTSPESFKTVSQRWATILIRCIPIRTIAGWCSIISRKSSRRPRC